MNGKVSKNLSKLENLVWVITWNTVNESTTFLPTLPRASAVLAVVVCLSVTILCPTKMAKPRITQTMARDSPGTL